MSGITTSLARSYGGVMPSNALRLRLHCDPRLRTKRVGWGTSGGSWCELGGAGADEGEKGEVAAQPWRGRVAPHERASEGLLLDPHFTGERKGGKKQRAAQCPLPTQARTANRGTSADPHMDWAGQTYRVTRIGVGKGTVRAERQAGL